MEDRPGKIFVGGLDFDIDEAEFEKIFSKFGKITEVLLKRDQQTGKSRGFGFITYENPSDADEAVKELDKQEVKGKMVHVDHAVKPGGGPGADRGGRGGFRGRGGPRGSFRGGFSDRGRGGFGDRGRGGFRGRGFRGDRGGRGGFGGRSRGFDRPMRGGFDDRRGPPTRRDSMERGYGDRGMQVRRDEDRYGVIERDRFQVSDRRPRDSYPPSPPSRGLERDPVSAYRDYGISSRDYSPPPRDRLSSRDYVSSREVGVSRSSYDTGRDPYSSRDPYASSSSRRDEYSSSSRDYLSSRESARDYLTMRESSRSSRDYERLTSRDGYDSYSRERMSSGASRGYGGSPPPRSRSPLPPSRSAYSPPRSAPISRELDRERIREYSPGARRPAPYDSHGAPPVKRSRPDELAPSRALSREVLARGIARERSPTRAVVRDTGRGMPPPSYRR